MGASVGEVGVAGRRTGLGVTVGAPHPTKNNMSSVTPIICWGKSWHLTFDFLCVPRRISGLALGKTSKLRPTYLDREMNGFGIIAQSNGWPMPDPGCITGSHHE